jgi:hypothetical protein
MAEFKTIETQEELNGIIEARLQRERAKYADYEQLKKDSKTLKELQGKKYDDQITALNGQIQKAQNDLTAMKTRAEAAERSLLRSRIAAEKHLPAELADRLTGDDEAALRADAEVLVKLIAPVQPPAPLADPGSGTDTGKWGDLSNALK